MNHRTGRLTWRDFEPSQDVPAPTFFTGPIEHTSDFGVLKPGATFNEPAPSRMVDVELDTPWFIPAAVVVFFLTLLASHLFARVAS